MKCLFIVTGRGLGGDAMTALNAMKALERKGVECEIALDESAHGTLFEKNGYNWHRISVPHAGGHSATKLSAVKGASKLIVATFKARGLIKKLKVDLISTPLDSKVCPKFNQCYILPELNMFRWDELPKNTAKAFYPLAENMGDGVEAKALEKLKEYPNFDENKKTIVFSSGSSIFKGMIDAINIVADKTDEYNLVLVGLPLKEEYGELIDEKKIVYVGYIDWINHLFKFADLTVLTDDGVSLEEAFTNGKPIVALARIKWGRYQNMAGVFKGAMIESSVEDVCESIDEAFKNYDSMQEKALVYGKQCMAAADDLAEDILKRVK